MTSRRILCFLALLLFPAGNLFAGSTGKISGVVADAKTKELLPGVNILVEGTTLGASTDFEGRYVILNVPSGKYNLIASFVGYKKLKTLNVQVSVDFTTQVDVAMEAGDIQMEAVEVRGDRSPLVRKDLTNPVASISSEAIGALPVTEISELIGMQAGVTVDDDGSIHIRGGYGNEIAYTLNGVNINNPYGNSRTVGLAANAVQEVSVSSGTFSAEYGTALSGVVNYVTKEGGRKWNGSIKYLGGDNLSAHKDLFFNIDEVKPTNAYRLEASLGGPLLDEDLSFFGSGVYANYGGHLYAQRLYNPEDTYFSREGFPTGDPRKGSSTAAYYFGPVRHETSDPVGLPSGDGAIVPLNWSKSLNLQGNVSYRLSSTMKLKYEAVYDRSESPASSSQSYRYKPDGRAIDKSSGLYQSVEMTNVHSERSFSTFKLSYIRDGGTSRAYDNYNDPKYLPSFYSRAFPNTVYLTGGVDLGRFDRTSTSMGLKFDLVSQVFSIHEVKTGFEFRTHDLNVESYTLQFKDPDDPTFEPSFSNVLVKNANFLPSIPTVEGGYLKYNRKPVQASAYVQDKIELFKSIILNLGVRYDYFDPKSDYNSDISSEMDLQDTIFLRKNLKPAEAKHMLAPRISVSYPIADQGAIRFSYGHFYQVGSLASLYRNPNYRAPLGTTPTFGNPNVNPQKAIQYELGLNQGFSEDIKVEITAYYKDVRDYILTQTIITPRGDKQYGVLTNLAYANTRGISVSLLKRRAPGELLSATLDYTFQIAEGNRTEPTDELYYNEQQGRLSETYLVPLSFDRGHSLTSTVVLSEPEDWSVSLLGYVRTGTPYTPSFPSSVVPITFVQNSDRQSLQWNVDFKAEMFVPVAGMKFSIFLQIDNLFDKENELSVYANSGKALYNITEAVQPTLFNDIKNRITRGDPGMIPMEAMTNYYAYPAAISMPRLVRLGFSVLF